MAEPGPETDILYISYFYHDRTLRARWLLPRLADHGFRVTVICAPPEAAGAGVGPAPSGPGAPLLHAVTDPMLPRLRWLRRARKRPRGGSPVSPTPPRQDRAGHLLDELLAYPDRWSGWIPGAILAARSVARSTPIRGVYVSSGPASNLIVGWVAAQMLGVPLVAEFRDLWVDNQFVHYRLELRRRLDRACEGRILRRCARVVVVTPPQGRLLQDAHPWLSADRLRLIPNGLDPAIISFFRNGESPHDASDRRQDRSSADPARFLLTYTGELYGSESPALLLRTIERLGRVNPGGPRVRVRFVGRVDDRFLSLLNEAAGRGFVELPGSCSFDDSLREMRDADGLLLLIGNGPRADGILTSKIFPYLASGKPILAAVPHDGVAAAMIRETGAGLVADPDSEDEIRTALCALVDKRFDPPPPERLLPVLDRHAWPNLAREVAAVLREALLDSGRAIRRAGPRG
jgi:glycosyltransferase involved in cell wall biosynthesis